MKSMMLMAIVIAGVANAQEAVVWSSRSSSQTGGGGVWSTAPALPERIIVLAAPESRGVSPAHADYQDDPAHSLYKEGYSLILSKKWVEARKKFDQLVKKYPKSRYVGAAEYWTAYSYSKTNEDRARDMYRKFIERNPESEYLDDAVADYERLIARTAPVPAPIVPPVPLMESAEAYVQAGELQRLEAEEAALAFEAQEVYAEPLIEGGIDEATRIKIEAIHALSRSTDSPEAFKTLQGLALDKGQSLKVREAALHALTRFKSEDVSSVLLSVAAGDEEALRVQAIYSLGRMREGDTEKTSKLLTQYVLDTSQPQTVREASLTTLSRLKSPEFYQLLVTLAKSDPNIEFRRYALYQIGRSGKENEQRSLAFLKEILLDQQQPPKVREAAIYALTLSKGGESVKLLQDIAKSDPDPRYRLSALYALSRRQKEYPKEVTSLLKQIAANESETDEIRVAALYGLRFAKTDDVFKLYKSLALKDKSEQIRVAAIRLLGENPEDKAEVVSTMIEVFQSASPADHQTLDVAMYSIANVGNDQAVKFLGTVAQTNESYEIRRRAIYYLGSIGGDEARRVLMNILSEK